MHWYSDTRGSGELWSEVFTAGERAATALGSVRDQAVMLNFLCWTAITKLGRTRQGLAFHHRATTAAVAAGDLVEQGWAQYYRAAIERLADNLPEALRRVDTAIELFHRASHETGEHLALSYRGVLLLRGERYEEAAAAQRAEITHHRSRTPRGTDDQNLGLKLSRLAESLLPLGELDEALTALDEAEQLLQDARATTTLAYVRYLRGRALIHQGNPTTAHTCLLNALADLDHPSTEVKILLTLADLHDTHPDTFPDPTNARHYRLKALAAATGDDTPAMHQTRHDLRQTLGLPQTSPDIA